MKNYRPTTIQSNEQPLRDAAAVIVVLFAFIVFPIVWPATELWRYYRLYTCGFFVTRKGRDAVEYQERVDHTIRRLLIGGEMAVKGRHVVYVPTDERWNRTMPAWARGRRAEIFDNVKRALGTKRFEFVSD
jgi:hypothetical protein